jgi:hypothetical protein
MYFQIPEMMRHHQARPRAIHHFLLREGRVQARQVLGRLAKMRSRR